MHGRTNRVPGIGTSVLLCIVTAIKIPTESESVQHLLALFRHSD